MGIFSFSTGELNLEQVDKLNKILPESLRKSVWKKSDFQGKDSLFDKLLNLEEVANNSIEKLQKKLDKKEGEFANIEASSIKIFNTELYNAEPLGLIDIGLVKKFSATSSGDRYSAGIIGYAIENALDKVYAENKVQTGAIEQAKLELLKKARRYYPSCNLLFKYEVDFRELGTSGNVFIYMRGTAAKGQNDLIDKALKEAKLKIEQLKSDIEKKKMEVKKIQELKSKIPEDKWEIEKLLGGA
ncbi:MAG: hypothetical protein AAFQ20_00100 [Bacteroidota bacterium]